MAGVEVDGGALGQRGEVPQGVQGGGEQAVVAPVGQGGHAGDGDASGMAQLGVLETALAPIDRAAPCDFRAAGSLGHACGALGGGDKGPVTPGRTSPAATSAATGSSRAPGARPGRPGAWRRRTPRWPSGARPPRQAAQGGRLGGVAAVVRQLPGARGAPDQQRPAPAHRVLARLQGHPRPLVVALPVRTRPARALLERRVRQRRGYQRRASAVNHVDLYPRGGRDGQHVAQPTAFDGRGQLRVTAVDLVPGHPPRSHAGVQRALDHRYGQRRLGREAHLLGHPGARAPLGVVRPRARQVQLPVDQRVATLAGVGQVDGDLAVLDAPGRPRVLALHPHGGAALLRIPGLVHDQHRLALAQVLAHEGAQLPGHRVGVPHRSGQQVLHPPRTRLPGGLGQGPTVLTPHVRQQGHDHHSQALTRLTTQRVSCYPPQQCLGLDGPPASSYPVQRGHRRACRSPHTSDARAMAAPPRPRPATPKKSTIAVLERNCTT